MAAIVRQIADNNQQMQAKRRCAGRRL